MGLGWVSSVTYILLLLVSDRVYRDNSPVFALISTLFSLQATKIAPVWKFSHNQGLTVLFSTITALYVASTNYNNNTSC